MSSGIKTQKHYEKNQNHFRNENLRRRNLGEIHRYPSYGGCSRAFANTMGLSCEGAAAILENPTTAAAFQNIATSFDCGIEDMMKDEKFNEIYQKSLPETDDSYWASYSDFDFDYDGEVSFTPIDDTNS